ncbi:MAG: hypothetical protein PF961_14170 [Planctomycetota bacterium]|nr:hypothetical protein [Planctomycetota bacterium]
MSSYSCPHYDFAQDACRRVKAACVPARTGCVLRGKVATTYDPDRRARERKQDRP